MRILIDTNVFIYREDQNIVPENLRNLLRIIRENNHNILLHPLSIEDINNDKNLKRKKIMISKLKSYPILNSPPIPDKEFLNKIKSKNNSNDPDNHILYSLFKDSVNILITEDKGIHHKALRINLNDRVFDIESALLYFNNLHERRFTHVLLKEDYIYNIDLNDQIFDSLKKDYDKFEQWFKKISKEGRKCWVYTEKNKIGAILIYKEENEALESISFFPKKKRFKISTFKVDLIGYKIGELLLKLTFKYCIKYNINEIYLTHFVKKEDYLVDLIIQFGFEPVSQNLKGETIYLKKLIPDDNGDIDPIKMSKNYYPSYKDGRGIHKFLIPIKPEYHIRLFQDYKKRQMRITEYIEFNIQGNTIKKAYLSHSRIRKIHPGDIILFYRSQDKKCITSLGVIEKIYFGLTSANEILNIIGKRSVYTYDEIINMIKKPITVIIFRHHFHFGKSIRLHKLLEQNIIRSAPQSIMEISHSKYQYIKKEGGIPERFAFD
jgi:hypothetical protein